MADKSWWQNLWPFAGKGERLVAQPRQLTDAVAFVDPSRLFGGRLSLPYNPSVLVTRKGLNIFDQMKADEQVKSALLFKKHAVLASGWEVVSPGDEEDDWEVTEFVRAAFEGVPGGTVAALRALLLGMDYGYCLRGDTLIHTLAGNIPIQDLVGQQPWVFSWQNGRLKLGKASRVWKTKSDAECIKVTYRWWSGAGGWKDDSIVCTPGHQFMLRDGSYRAAGKLKPDDRLMPFSQKGNKRALVQVMRGYGKSVWLKRAHWVIQELGQGLLPWQHVHHLNEDTMDDRPENLQRKNRKDHVSEHSKKWFARASSDRLAERSQKIRVAREKNCDAISANSTAANVLTWKDPVIRARRIAGMTGKKHKGGWKMSAVAREKIRAAKKAYWEKRRLADNHEVVAVEPAGIFDVYDMTVPGFHNFAANNIMVHNSVTEKVYADGVGELEGRMTIGRLVSAKPHYFDFECDAHGQVNALLQKYVPGQGAEVPMPPDKFIVYTHDREFENPYGRSDLEAAYRAWWAKDNAYKWFTVSLERYGMPPLFLLYNKNAYQANEVTKLKNVVKGIQNATMGVIPRDNKDDLEFWSTQLAGQAKDVFLAALARFDADIAKALLQPSLTGFSGEGGGTENRGSLARANVHWKAFLYVVGELQTSLATVVNEQLVRQLCDLNFPGLKSYPQFKFARLDDEAELELFKTWQALVMGKVVNKIPDDETHIRAALGFPENDDPQPLPDAAPTAGSPFGGRDMIPGVPDSQVLKPPHKIPEEEQTKEMRAFAEESGGTWVEADGAVACYAEWV